MARIAAEEAYIQALSTIEFLPPSPPAAMLPNFDKETSYAKALEQYELSIKRTVSGRRELVTTMQHQLEVLQILKDHQQKRHLKINTTLGEKNSNYLSYRIHDLAESQKIYKNKCAELEQEDSREVEGTQSNEVRDIEATKQQHRLSRAGLHAIRAHLAKAHVLEHNHRIAKLKHQVIDADREYRKSVLFLEGLRKKQLKTTHLAIKHIEILFMDKSEIAKSVLRNILVVEQAVQGREMSMTQSMTQTSESMNGMNDMALFTKGYGTLHFDVPDAVVYEHYIHGPLKDVQFGTSLKVYAEVHKRNVPLLVEQCIQAVERMGGLQKEGIYRISGRQTAVNALKLDFEKDEQQVDIDQYDIFTIASLLKVYLRELEDPLLAMSPKQQTEYTATKDDKHRLHILEVQLAQLPESHRLTLQMLIEHLARIAANAKMNKMTTSNLAMIFTPAILHDEQAPDKVLLDLISHQEALFAKITKKNKEDQLGRSSLDDQGSLASSLEDKAHATTPHP
ncbi:Rho GTPase activation protein [Lichtheimia hyalospora FSU 10163]|nr:Rho GTPase activation protein [Lichtheimia hyalospora FSU 10163]